MTGGNRSDLWQNARMRKKRGEPIDDQVDAPFDAMEASGNDRQGPGEGELPDFRDREVLER